MFATSCHDTWSAVAIVALPSCVRWRAQRRHSVERRHSAVCVCRPSRDACLMRLHSRRRWPSSSPTGSSFGRRVLPTYTPTWDTYLSWYTYLSGYTHLSRYTYLSRYTTYLEVQPLPVRLSACQDVRQDPRLSIRSTASCGGVRAAAPHGERGSEDGGRRRSHELNQQ